MANINSSSNSSSPGDSSGLITGLTKKLLLWLIVIMQICFIGTFWLLQGTTLDENSSLPVRGGGGGKGDGRNIMSAVKMSAVSQKSDMLLLARLKAKNDDEYLLRTMPERGGVRFVTKVKRQKPNELLKRQQQDKKSFGGGQGGVPLKNVNNFTKDFFMLKTNRLINATSIDGSNEEADIAKEIYEAERMEGGAESSDINQKVWCFREGTLNSSTARSNNDNELDLVNNWNDIMTTEILRCHCEQQWHARDCGQPEIIWRALLLAKGQLKLRDDVNTLGSQAQIPHYLVYFLEGNFYSLDLLELQIKSVIEVVDYFVIYWTSSKISHNDLKALQHRLKELLSSERYTLYYCKNSFERRGEHEERKQSKKNALPAPSATCSTKYAYKYFRKQMKTRLPLKSSDLLLYTRDREILLPHTLKFLKYYASEPMQSVLRFRLKHNIYGYFWQHPKRTTLSAAISSFAQVDNPNVANGNPAELLLQTTGNIIIIGDLNHYGGWFCQYCQHPDEIIKEFQSAGQSTGLTNNEAMLPQVQFPNDTRSHSINADYVQQLIARGLYIDGKTQLVRQRQQSDKYYAPNYAMECNWKFGNLLTNYYENLDDDLLDDN